MLALALTGTAAEGDWLIADRQSSGRGRLGRVWVSPPGNLYASGLVRLRAGDPPAATLAFVTAVAVWEAVTLLQRQAPSGGRSAGRAPAFAGAQLRLKWPNDLLVGPAKLAGTLLEREGDAVVIGVGVNLAHHPATLDRAVTSLAVLGVASPEPTDFLNTLAEIFARWLARWRSEGLPVIRAAWLERAHAVGTALSAALPDGSRVDGLFDGLTEDCTLRLRLADGSTRVIHAGDVFLI